MKMKAMALPELPDLDAIHAAAMADAKAIPCLVRELVDQHGEWNSACLNLVASHNYLSPGAKAMLCSSVADLILSGSIGKRSHAGSAWIDAIDTLVVDLAKRIFQAAAVEYRAMSGAQANGIVLTALTRPGDTIVAYPARQGGHKTYRERGYAGALGLNVLDMPYDEARGEVDLDRLEDLVRRKRPKLLIVGTATMLLPVPLGGLRGVADAVGAKLMYDGAHILGLVAGGQFQDPLGEGAHILTGSTQKTLGGPIGGLILSNDADVGDIIARATSAWVSNYHNNRIAALAVTLAETAHFGHVFAAAIVANARALAAALEREGVPVVTSNGRHTDSHIVLLDTDPVAEGEHLFDNMEKARLLTSRAALPHTYPETRGIRLGASAITRVGMDADAMTDIAILIGRVVRGDALSSIAGETTALARSYRTVRYCF